MDYDNTSICVASDDGLDGLIWKIGAFVLPVFGIPGHCILIITKFFYEFRRFHPTFLYFIFMALIEIIYLLLIFWDWLAVMEFVDDPRERFDCTFFYLFIHGTANISLLLLAQLNLDRVSMICSPHRALSSRRILLKIFLTSTLLFLFFLHYYFSLDSASCQVHSYAHRWFYFIWPYVHLVARIVPCLIVVACTIFILINRCSTPRPRRKNSFQQTFTVILVLFAFYTFAAVLSVSCLNVVHHTIWRYETDCLEPSEKIWKILTDIAILWETSIYTSKFYIRLFFSSEFRSNARRVLSYRRKTLSPML